MIQLGSPDPTKIISTDPTNHSTSATVTSNQVIVTDKLGFVTTYNYVGSSFRAGDAYKYVNRGIGSILYPDGNKDIYEYDSRFNIVRVTRQPKPGSALTAQVWSTQYPACTSDNFRICNKPTLVQDPALGRTDFTYDPVHGGVLTEVSPGDSSGQRASKRYEYGQLSASYMDANGNMSSGLPIWKLLKVHACASSVSCFGMSDETVTSYEYDGNLLVKGITITANGQTSRTCYVYDRVGNRISETKPRANQASCS